MNQFEDEAKRKNQPHNWKLAIVIDLETATRESNVRSIPSMKPYFTEEDLSFLKEGFENILRSGKLTLGEYTEKFEREFANYVGVRHAVAANSGTCTLEMIYRALDVRDREVITPTNTQIATSNAVIFAGGKPILSEMDSSSLCVDVEDAFSKVNNKTKALVVVHIAGLIHPRIDEITERCESAGIILIEDAAHAHGALKKGKKAGSLSRAGSFSFYPAKVITSVEGGMVTTDDDEIAEQSRSLRNHGNDSRGLQVRLGYNWRMSELHSLVGLTQLRRIEEILGRKNQIARLYNDTLSQSDAIELIETPADTRHSYYKYALTLNKSIDVQNIRQKLKSKFGIETGSIYYPPCHLQPVYMEMFGFKMGSFPVAEDILGRTVTLPISAGMEYSDAEYVAQNLLATLGSAK